VQLINEDHSSRPVRILPETLPIGNVYVQKLLDDSTGLQVFFRHDSDLEKMWCIRFGDTYGYRSFDESDLNAFWESIGGHLVCGCYQTSNSDFLDWAKRQSVSQELPTSLSHYLFVSVNDVVDVLSFGEPTIFASDSQ